MIRPPYRETGIADEATLTLILDPDRFVAEAEGTMRTADDVLRALVRDSVDRRRTSRDAEIDRTLREADDPRAAFAGDEEIEAERLRERSTLLRRIDDDAA